MTNDLTTIKNSLETVNGAADYLMQAPAAALVFVMCILLGYFLKMIPKFPNNLIPLTIHIAGPVGFLLMEVSKPTQVNHPEIMRLIIGLALASASWITHKLVLRKWIDPKLFTPDGDTMVFINENKVVVKDEDKKS